MNIQSGCFSAYLQKLANVARQGDAREESYYSTLSKMLEEFAQTAGRTHVHVTTLPRPTDGGNPDFRVWNGTDRIIGYIEAKNPTEEQLDHIEGSKQLDRYRSTFPNLILTNFLEFRLYRDGERIETVLAGRPFVLNTLQSVPPLENQDELQSLLDRFLSFELPRSFNAESLAIELAKRTRILREVISEQYELERNSPDRLTGFFEAFQTYLIGSLTPDDFADLFAQTITYGLFAARTRAGEDFNRRVAFDNIPPTIGVLRDLFRFISLDELPESLAWCVDDIAEVLSVADAPGILDRFYREGKGRDPIVHFYETFLAQYDPDERERRGVYYTPDPVVGYIVRSLHNLLKTEFDKPDGLASDGVTLLDPAAGTMTFVARAAHLAVKEFEEKYGSGGREDFIRNHVLKNFYALELMMAPYAVGHLKMSFFLEELGHRLSDNERVPFYLTNTLDVEVLERSRIPGLSALAEESHLAGEVKKQTPILLILGNPPYSGHSSNKGEWIRGLIEDYKKVDGKPLGEKNPKWLQDDYVKFLRFAQWKIEQAGCGLVGLITNHSYLDAQTFRGVRRSLMETYDEIYILNLHGSSQRPESVPDGFVNQNVFDIQQGVAIAFFVKRRLNREGEARVYYCDNWGRRADKYNWLKSHYLADTEWQQIHPVSGDYLFVPQNVALKARYDQFPSIPCIFPVNSVGIVTARDRLTIHWSDQDVWNTVVPFSRMASELAREAYQLGDDARDWKVAFAQQDLLDSGPSQEKIVPILYRPFDKRYTYYTGRSRGFICNPRPEVMRNLLGRGNVAFHVCRQTVSGTWQHCLVTDGITDDCYVSNKSRERGYTCPLYTYSDADVYNLFSDSDNPTSKPNLNPEIVAALSKAYNRELSPEQVFYYIYAVLYAPSYREKYVEFLRRKYPRIPFAADSELFTKLAGFGMRLADLHLLKSSELDPPISRFEGEGDSVIATSKSKGFRYKANEQRMYINETQYFDSISSAVYEYQIGGYQVCDKWLKDRKERSLKLDDIRTYCRMVTALAKTLEIQQELDDVYEDVEENCVTFETG